MGRSGISGFAVCSYILDVLMLWEDNFSNTGNLLHDQHNCQGNQVYRELTQKLPGIRIGFNAAEALQDIHGEHMNQIYAEAGTGNDKNPEAKLWTVQKTEIKILKKKKYRGSVTVAYKGFIIDQIFFQASVLGGKCNCSVVHVQGTGNSDSIDQESDRSGDFGIGQIVAQQGIGKKSGRHGENNIFAVAEADAFCEKGPDGMKKNTHQRHVEKIIQVLL